MCGIVGYVGKRLASPLLLEALRRLEYRGYDSAGICTIHDSKILVKKDRGKIDEIEQKLRLSDLPGNIGLGHTRWATHGEPSQRNAHPHLDNSGKIAVVHNGIIENYLELRKFLERKGFRFLSETDTEVIPNLISYFLSQGDGLEEAIRKACLKLRGSFALGVLCVQQPDTVFGVRKESPLVVALGKNENFISSDIPAVLKFTRRIVVLQDFEVAKITAESYELFSLLTGKRLSRKPLRISWSVEMAEKGGYPHFMLKEIFEQPVAIKETLRSDYRAMVKLGDFMLRAKKTFLVGCGTSYHAALLGKYFFSRLAGLSTEAVLSSEFQESCSAGRGDLVIAITQSGETADTLKAVRVAKENGAKTSCLVNVVGSTITRETDLTCYTHSGPEVSVVATKTFTSQIVFLLRLALHLSHKRVSLSRVPELVQEMLERSKDVTKELAKKYRKEEDIYIMGRGIAYPVALEGALKLKEVAYIHAEALAGGELKHGTLALIEEGVPVIALVPPGEAGKRMLNNIEEVKARGAEVFAIGVGHDRTFGLPVPSEEELYFPFLAVVPLQLLAYWLAVERGCDPDRPRHLAKSVTVE